MNLENYIKNVPNFPIEGIQFKDITPLIGDSEAFKEAITRFTEFVQSVNATVIMGPESRGFIFGCPTAVNANLPFVPVRKPGKLPRETVKESYALEYGTNTIEIHKDSLKKGDRVVIIDDLLATGGTMEAAVKLATKLGAEVVGIAFLIELVDLEGVKKLGDIPVCSLIKY